MKHKIEKRKFRETKYIQQRLEWLKDLEKELFCFVREIESKLDVIERRLK